MITGITHLAYAVADLNRTVDFYCGKLGFEKLFSLENDKGQVWLQYTKAAHGQYVEFFPADRVEPQSGQSFCHMCLESDDLLNDVDLFRSRGIKINQEVKEGADGALQAWIEDPDGNPIELMQLLPGSMQRQRDPK